MKHLDDFLDIASKIDKDNLRLFAEVGNNELLNIIKSNAKVHASLSDQFLSDSITEAKRKL